jgi:crotonobetainyl-CoA:carnitine CoA-transferase CaiB-like acyl-CoA transferase
VVLDLAAILAAPVSATLLGEFGAEVIKVEQPGVGDFPRHHAARPGGRTPQWAQEGRNKRSVTLDLRRPEAQALARDLARRVDVVVTNYRPSTAERWGLAPADLLAVNDQLVVLSVTGYGLTGPYRDRGAFDRVVSAFSGHTAVSGYPDRPPVRAGFAVIDYMSAYLGAFAVLAALRARDRGQGGQVVDLALYEAAFRATEGALAEWAGAGAERHRVGNRHPRIVPATEAEAADGRAVSYHAGTPGLFERLAKAIGRPELVTDPRFATAPARVEHQDALYAEIGAWVAGRPAAEAVAALSAADVPASLVHDMADLLDEPHVRARGAIESVDDPDFGTLPLATPVPRLSATPGRTRFPGEALGASTRAVLSGLLGLEEGDLDRLEAAGVL